MKLNIKPEEDTHLLKLLVTVVSSKCIQVTDDLVRAGHFTNEYTINLT